MNELTVNQPTGIKAFGWGLLGFFGANIIMNVIFATAEVLWMGVDSPAAVSLIALAAIATAFSAAYWFAQTRDYEATRTGAYVSIGLQAFAVVLGMIGAI